MKVRLEELKDKPLSFSIEERVEEFPLLRAVEEEGDLRFLSPLHVQLKVAREFGHVRVEGRVDARIGLDCSRCLTKFDMVINSPFTIFYTPAQGNPQDEEIELAEQDLISATYEGDEIDLDEEIAEQVMMEIPLKPICREDCRGLCSKCGADLNLEDCGCERSDFNLKFSTLKNFKVNK